jgi:hypothetical protein
MNASKIGEQWKFCIWVCDHFCRLLVSLVSAGLLIAPIVALTYIHSLPYMLIVVSLFALSVGGFIAVATGEKSSTMFGLTAAYAAVLVVFVGTLIEA